MNERDYISAEALEQRLSRGFATMEKQIAQNGIAVTAEINALTNTVLKVNGRVTTLEAWRTQRDIALAKEEGRREGQNATLKLSHQLLLGIVALGSALGTAVSLWQALGG